MKTVFNEQRNVNIPVKYKKNNGSQKGTISWRKTRIIETILIAIER